MYFKETVELYDEIYTRMKNYGEEAEKIRAGILAAHPNAKTVLDVACGTAEHARHLKKHFELDGLDINEDFLAKAREKNPECGYFQGDMTAFKAPRKYDVVLSLFSSIGYVLTEERLTKTLKCFAEHLNPGGIVVVEPWLTPANWNPSNPFMFTINEPDFKVCRMNITETRNGHSYFEWHFLVSRPGYMKHFTEEHTLGLFSVEQTKRAFAAAGLSVEHDEKGIFGRGLYTARLR
jgi:ubiquinone/menaquinone biosynthesis C-methylase UbiE